MQYQILSVVVMALASYIPRFIPITFLKKKIKSMKSMEKRFENYKGNE